MRLCCPRCGQVDSIERFADEAAARDTIALALKWPRPLADRLMRYLGLFRPERRALRWPRAQKLLSTLLTDLDRGAVKRHGRDWAAPQAAWEAALDVVMDQVAAGKLRPPLKDHAYLYSIIANGADRAEAVAEEQREQSRRRPQASLVCTDDDRAERNREVLAKSLLINEMAARQRLQAPSMDSEAQRAFLADHGVDATRIDALLQSLPKESP